MTYEQRKQERQALIEHLLTQDWDVFGTLKFVNGRTIDRKTENTLLSAVRQMRTRIRFLAQPESMHSIVGATQLEQRFD